MVHFCDQKHHVVVIGAGFGGLSVVRELEEPGVSITIIDRSNHHLFQPLLYQVAGVSLPSAELPGPFSLFRHREDVRTLMAEVQDVDTDSREVLLKDGSRIDYDTLVVATGATHAYFGHDEWEQFAPEGTWMMPRPCAHGSFPLLNKLRIPLIPLRAAYQTFVIVGGPTGVELSGTIAELARKTLKMISVLLIRQRPELFWLKPDNDCSLPSRSHYRNIPSPWRNWEWKSVWPTGNGMLCRRRSIWWATSSCQNDHLGSRRHCFSGCTLAQDGS